MAKSKTWRKERDFTQIPNKIHIFRAVKLQLYDELFTNKQRKLTDQLNQKLKLDAKLG